MRLLLLSFYYTPDLSAGSFRCSALVAALQKELPDLQIDVLTTQPNRYNRGIEGVASSEHIGNVRIRRFTLPPHDSGMRDQVWAFAAYARKVLRTIYSEKRSYDAVFATSSRLMTAGLGAFTARKLDLPLYLDIRDLFADTIKDVLPAQIAQTSRPFIRLLERWTLRSASRINIVSEGFAQYVRTVAPCVELRNFTNGIDEEFLKPLAATRRRQPNEPLLIVYAGNVGEGQGLDLIIPEAAKRMDGRARFRIIGHGGRMRQLKASLLASDAHVECFAPVPRADLHHHYAAADILLIHLNDYAAFRKVLPSKIFEYAATGRPIVAGVAGFSAEFIRENVACAQVFAPCDVDGLVNAIEKLADVERSVDRVAFVKRFARRTVMAAMARDIHRFMYPCAQQMRKA